MRMRGRAHQQNGDPPWRSAQQGFTLVRRSAQQGFTLVRRSAQQGFTLVRRSAQQGFTLVELMVVIVIIGLAASVVVLAMPDPGGGVAAEAERFAARAKAARDMAIVEARPAMLGVDAAGYQVSRGGAANGGQANVTSGTSGTGRRAVRLASIRPAWRSRRR